MTATVINGVAWFDDRGEPVNAHGGCLIREGDRYYLFGEYKTDDENTFVGFACYSSPDLATWRFERMALPQQPDGLLGPARIGERPKVMRSPGTGQYVMVTHCDDLAYTDPHIGYAVSSSITGPYEFCGPMRFEGEPLRRWDVGAFVDDDGTGYLLVHEGDVYRLTDDFTAIAERVVAGIAPGGESPGMVKTGGRYHLLFSNKTSWERNDNYVLSAEHLGGPWTPSGLLAPPGALTHDSQCGFVLHAAGDAGDGLIFLGDRWSFPHQASAASYVWLPMTVDDDGVPRLPRFEAGWRHDTLEPVDPLDGARRLHDGGDLTDPGQCLELSFGGGRVAITGVVGPDRGYARISVVGPDGGEIHGLHVDFYSARRDEGLRYVGPDLPPGAYRLTITATGERPRWSKKDGTVYGASDHRVEVTGIHLLASSEPPPA